MKCSYCNSNTNLYQSYDLDEMHVRPYCHHHTNRRTEIFEIPEYIPDAQHQKYLWDKHGEFTDGPKLEWWNK